MMMDGMLCGVQASSCGLIKVCYDDLENDGRIIIIDVLAGYAMWSITATIFIGDDTNLVASMGGVVACLPYYDRRNACKPFVNEANMKPAGRRTGCGRRR
jgi:hypothetical protein